ncbi:hypothetical protein PFICI_07931 [Pestalotiopsis fici W106-1]|uniref:NACHT domain-containing protein n=1 Tax=Pestalotiopsis fici (strain W106-1 / CGMCC3.15140) TaxID=1229662 RepID=W3X4T2_PESFW|nr:uncharacterized protein PFICI_07931 [Pestalotiopsis fici W106-1]ETS80402.1 hypothetical protein PFICI_07931 [Pestalotiopsis fici W106-1]
MADPLSVAGSAVGIISLGIQVAQSLFDYYNAVKSQHSDVAHTIRKLDSLLEILGSLQHRIDGRRFRADEQDAVRKIESLINESEECIQELQDEAEKFKQCPVGTIQSAVRTTARRVAYPFRRSTLEKLDEDVDDIVDRLKLALQLLQQEVTGRVQDDVEDIKALLKLVKSSQDSSGIQQWLNAPDATTNFNEACAKRQPQTGLWLVKGQRFTDWVTSHRSFLWLRGFAGCGKSVLCSTAIQHTYRHRRSNPQIGIAFFFFTFNDEDKQATSALLRALVSQLSTQAVKSTHLARLRDSYRQAAPPDEALLGCLRQLIGTFQDVYILIDALDESPRDKHREAVLQLLTDIRAWQEPRLHLLVTSRDEVDIRDELDLDPSLIIEMRNSEVDQDITAFIRQTLQDKRKFAKWKKHHNTIQDALTQRANGMFRWVECQFRSLARCPPNQQLLEQLLHSLPKSLDDTYARMLENIAPDLVDYAKQMLTILCCAIRPLSDTELLDALAVRIDSDCSHDYSYDATRRFNDISALEEICPGFMEVDTDFNTRDVTIRLAHFSVREFLEAKRILQYEAIALFHVQRQIGHTHMAGICLASLLYPQQKDNKALSKVTEESALLRYAARHWPEHFTQCGSKSIIEMQSWPLFQTTGPYFMRWVRTWNIDEASGRFTYEAPKPLYYVAFLGLNTIAAMLLGSHDMNFNSELAPGSDSTIYVINRTAASRDHIYVLESLSEDMDINVNAGRYGTALHAAAANGHESTVQLLLEKGADVNDNSEMYRTALHVAAANGHESTVQLLLEKGADINAEGKVYGTALHIAAAEGHESIVQLLLEKGADMNAEGKGYGTALHIAAAEGHENIVKLLLEKGAI